MFRRKKDKFKKRFSFTRSLIQDHRVDRWLLGGSQKENLKIFKELFKGGLSQYKTACNTMSFENYMRKNSLTNDEVNKSVVRCKLVSSLLLLFSLVTFVLCLYFLFCDRFSYALLLLTMTVLFACHAFVQSISAFRFKYKDFSLGFRQWVKWVLCKR